MKLPISQRGHELGIELATLGRDIGTMIKKLLALMFILASCPTPAQHYIPNLSATSNQIREEVLVGHAPVLHAYLATGISILAEGMPPSGTQQASFLSTLAVFIQSPTAQNIIESDKIRGQNPNRKAGDGSLGAAYTIYIELVTGVKSKLTPARRSVIKNDILPMAACGTLFIRDGKAVLDALIKSYGIGDQEASALNALHTICKDAENAKRDAEIAKRDAEIAKRDAEIAKRDAEIAKRDALRAEIVSDLLDYTIKGRGDLKDITHSLRINLNLFDRSKDHLILPILTRFLSGETKLSREDLTNIRSWNNP